MSNTPKVVKSSNPANGLVIMLSGLSLPTTFPPTSSVSVPAGPFPIKDLIFSRIVSGFLSVGAIGWRPSNLTPPKSSNAPAL